MSNPPRPEIKPGHGSIREARDYFLGLPAPANPRYAAYKAEKLLEWMVSRYPGCRLYEPATDGDLDHAKKCKHGGRRGSLDLRSKGCVAGGVGGAEHGEVFVRVNERGRKEWILPAIPAAVVWSRGVQTLDRQGWVVLHIDDRGSTDGYERLVCPAYVLKPNAPNQPRIGRVPASMRKWKAGWLSGFEQPYGLSVESNGTKFERHYQVYRISQDYTYSQ
ncbi:hypothetical protein Rt10032_c02g1119 [Rhodotorula toruloides]|uniref:Uncharacterized protein n=1 Tax=Rhodotorula toruloides TaxID=5286 RepID=A0A511K9T9_RHOTO|nr:hypothetical protein Rt10032_c02g1119 [Rhodotorula toruloides]